MLKYSVKQYIKLLQLHCKTNRYILELKGTSTGYIYRYNITNENITLVISSSDTELLYTTISNINFNLDLQDANLEMIKFKEIKYKPNGTLFEENLKVKPYEAQLYITLFNLMDKRGKFKLKYEEEIYDGFYLEGKTMLIKEDEEYYTVLTTDLHKLNLAYPGYTIILANPLLKRHSYNSLLNELQSNAVLKDKVFNKTTIQKDSLKTVATQ